MLNNYYDDIEALGNPKQQGMFGTTQTPTKKLIREAAVKLLEKHHGKDQISLFEEQPPYGSQGSQTDRIVSEETKNAKAESLRADITADLEKLSSVRERVAGVSTRETTGGIITHSVGIARDFSKKGWVDLRG